jgi:hypothetical protein
MVRCPRLTTSNLKDASTKKTPVLLSAYAVPDAATIASSWSKPPSTCRQPPKAVIVNYSQQDFPSMVKTSKPRATKATPTSNTHFTPQQAPLDTASVHSNTSATSAGTNFTKEDGQSIFTSLTESFMDDLKSQNALVVANHKNMMELMQAQSERDAKLREEQYRENASLREAQLAQSIKRTSVLKR